MIPYKSSIPLAAEVGAQRITTVREMADLMKSLKEKGIYTIARIVVFKDNPLALARPDWAVKTQNGEIWRDRENLAWVDPFNKEVWDYNINIAIEAAQYGFDEIQFDYVRFPDASGLRFSMPNTEENRVKAISGFLMEARRRLIPYNVFRFCGHLWLCLLESATIPILDKGSKTLPPILTISVPCFTHPDFSLEYPVTEILLQTPMKSSIFPLNEPKNGPVSHPIVSDHGCRHSEIMPLTEDTSRIKRSRARSRRLKNLVPMAGCSGIQGTIIPLTGLKKEKPLG